VYSDVAGDDCVHVSIEAVPTDVGGDGDFDGQRAAEEVEDVGAMDGTAVQEAVCSEADAGADFAGVGAAVCGDGKSAEFVRDEPFVIFPKG
jgi:hypothetical protein